MKIACDWSLVACMTVTSDYHHPTESSSSMLSKLKSASSSSFYNSFASSQRGSSLLGWSDNLRTADPCERVRMYIGLSGIRYPDPLNGACTGMSANTLCRICSLVEAPQLVSKYESRDNIQNVVGLRWLYALTKPPLGPHPWGAYDQFLDRLNSHSPDVVRHLRDVDVSDFLQDMMGSTGGSLAFLCVDEADRLGKDTVRSPPECVLSQDR